MRRRHWHRQAEPEAQAAERWAALREAAWEQVPRRAVDWGRAEPVPALPALADPDPACPAREWLHLELPCRVAG